MTGLTREDLLSSFPDLLDLGDEVLKCKTSVPAYTFHYYVRLSAVAGGVDRLMVSQDREDDVFAREVLTRLEGVSLEKGLSFTTMPSTGSAFTRVLLAPPRFHAYFNGILDRQRERLVLCVPVFASEFTGKETAGEFREMCYRYVPVRDWTRRECPKILLRFDNPKTGGGTNGRHLLATYETVLDEIDELTGTGFIELLNYKEQVLEILREGEGDREGSGAFVLLRDRDDSRAQSLGRSALVEEVWRFLAAPAAT
jgi:hypothetical protein